MEKRLEKRAETSRLDQLRLEQLRVKKRSTTSRVWEEAKELTIGKLEDLPEYKPESSSLDNFNMGKFLKDVSLDMGNQMFRGLKDVGGGVLGTAEGVMGALEWVGVDSAKPLADKAAKWQEVTAPEDPHFVNNLLRGVGSMATFFIPGIGAAKGVSMIGRFSPTLAKWAGASVMTLFESATEAGEVYRTNKEMGKSDEEASKRATQDFGVNLALLGITNKLGFFGKDSTGLLGAIKRRLISGGMEGVQEMGQQVIGNITTDRPWDEGVGEAGAIGTILGIGLSGTTDSGSSIPVRVQLKIKDIFDKAKQKQKDDPRCSFIRGKRFNSQVQTIRKDTS